MTYRAVAFALGALGLLAFAAAGVLALTAQPDASCGAIVTCKRESLAKQEFPVALAAALGAALMAAAVLFLFLQFRQDRRRPKRAAAAAPARSHGPIVTTTRPRPPRP
ncbi:MAG: hypothetical protein QOD77_1834 [Thermoplasmata archaeon]|nr:hypothetical protein [Thermoplasmata archaeon]